MDLTGLAAGVGSWPEIKSVLVQLCRDLKPDRIIVQDEQSRKLVFPITCSLAKSKLDALHFERFSDVENLKKVIIDTCDNQLFGGFRLATSFVVGNNLVLIFQKVA